MRKASWMTSVILVIGLLVSLIPQNASSQAEMTTTQSEIQVTEAVILNATGKSNTPDHPIDGQGQVAIELMWQMSSPDLIEEGETRQLILPKELTYSEQGGQLPNGMGSFQVSNGMIHFTFTKNYQMEADGMVPDYRSVKQYQGSLTIQAEVTETDTSELSLDFGNQVIKSLFIKPQTTNEPAAMAEQQNTGRNLNDLGTWVIRSMNVFEGGGGKFTEENPPTRDDNIRIDFTWALKNEVEIQAGDYYTYQLPDYFAVHQPIKNQTLINPNPGEESLGTFDLDLDGLLTIRFNDKAVSKSERSGTITIFTQLDVKEEITKIITEEQIDEDGEISGKVEVTVATAQIKKSGSIGKDNVITWEIIINENSRKLSNVKVTDVLQEGHEFLSTDCEVPDGNGGWKKAESGFYQCLHFRPAEGLPYFELTFPTLKQQDQKLTHPVKFTVRSKITESVKVNDYRNDAGIEGDNVRGNSTYATVSLVNIPSYKFLIDSQFEKGILDWRIKATIKNDGGAIIDQMYKSDIWPEGALHYLDKSTLKIENAKGEDLEKDEWEFDEAEEETKKDASEVEQIVRFSIKFKKAGTYYISYQTKTFDVPPPLDEDITNYLWIEGEKYDGSTGIGDDDLLGVIKYHVGIDYMKREMTWWTSINKNKVVMKNAVIEDKYSKVNGNAPCALRLNEKTLKIYPLKDNPVNDNDIDETRELERGEDYELISKGDNYEKGFIIKLKGKYAETSETLQIRYNTHFMMEKQSDYVRGKSNHFTNSAIVTYVKENEEDGFDSDEAQIWVDAQMSKNLWKYGAFVAKGEEYKNQVSPFAGEKPKEDSVYWTVPINSWGLKLEAGTVISDDIHEGQINPEVKLYRVTYDRPEFGITGLGTPLIKDTDYELIPKAGRPEDFDIKLLKTIDEPFALFIKVKADEDTFKYKNKASMDYEGTTLEVEAFVEKSYKTDWLSKNGSQEKKENETFMQANYEIVLNKDSRTINKPIITDTVKINEQTFQKEDGLPIVKAYKTKKVNGKYVKLDPVDLTKDGRSAKITADTEAGTETLTILLGASISEPLLIEYSTNIDPAIPNGTQITNRAILSGANQQISEAIKRVEINSTHGSGTSEGVDGALIIKKVDENDGLIDGIAEFALFRVDSNNNLHDFMPNIKVKGDRIIQIGEGPIINLEKIANLRYGNYAIQETKAPDGYELEDSVDYFSINSDLPNHEYTYKKTNKKIKPFELSILKKSMMGDRVLKGGEFSLNEQGNESILATTTTEADGVGKFVDEKDSPYVLELGKTYIVKETKAPDGFVKLKGEFTVSISEQGKVTVKYDGDELDEEDVRVQQGKDGSNSQIEFTARNNPQTPLPKTGGAGAALLATLGLVGLIVGLWYHSPLKKKEGLS